MLFKASSLIGGYSSPLNPKPYRSLLGTLKGTLVDPFKGTRGVSENPRRNPFSRRQGAPSRTVARVPHCTKFELVEDTEHPVVYVGSDCPNISTCRV